MWDSIFGSAETQELTTDGTISIDEPQLPLEQLVRPLLLDCGA